MPTQKGLDAQIQERISDFVDDISQLVRAAALEAVQAALGAEAASAPRPARAARKTSAKRASAPGRKKKRVRRTADQVNATANDVLAHVTANPGKRLGEIAKSLGMPTKDVRRPAFMLVEAGSLRTEGQRGGTRYFSGGKAKAASPRKAAKKRRAKKKASKR